MKAVLRGWRVRRVRAQGVIGLLVLTSLIDLTNTLAGAAVSARKTPTSAGLRLSNFPAHATEQKRAAHASAYRLSLSEVPVDELAAYRRDNDVLRLPFDSTLANIRTCLRRSENAIQPCLDEANPACETDTSQCATAATQAWELYISRYLKLLQKALPTERPDISQKLWKDYVDAECAFETTPYPSDAAMRHNVEAVCQVTNAEKRALELRGTLINANSDPE